MTETRLAANILHKTDLGVSLYELRHPSVHAHHMIRSFMLNREVTLTLLTVFRTRDSPIACTVEIITRSTDWRIVLPTLHVLALFHDGTSVMSAFFPFHNYFKFNWRFNWSLLPKIITKGSKINSNWILDKNDSKNSYTGIIKKIKGSVQESGLSPILFNIYTLARAHTRTNKKEETFPFYADDHL